MHHATDRTYYSLYYISCGILAGMRNVVLWFLDWSLLVDPLSYSLFQAVLHDWCNKGCGMWSPVCGMVHIKEPLLLNGFAMRDRSDNRLHYKQSYILLPSSKYSVNVMMLTLSVLFQGGDKESERGAQTQGAAAAVVQPCPAGAAGDLHVQLLQVDQHQLAASGNEGPASPVTAFVYQHWLDSLLWCTFVMSISTN